MMARRKRTRRRPKSAANPHLERPNERKTGGVHVDPSVYLSVCRRNRAFAPASRWPLYKVAVPDSSSLLGAAATWEGPSQILGLGTGMGGKTFISLPSPPGWIIGVGGDPGGTIIVDTTSEPPKVIRGPNLLAAKWSPVVAAVGSKVYALVTKPSYKEKPNFVPWFEVLDLSNYSVVANTADGSLSLDGCSWKELSWPACFPRRLCPRAYTYPPIISVLSYVVLRPYILISVRPDTPCTYAFHTDSGEWHKMDNTSLPFIGPATPLRHGGCVFLGSSLENGSVRAYRIRVDESSTVSLCATALQLSITVFRLRDMAHEQLGSTAEQHIVSLNRGRFSLLTFILYCFKHFMGYRGLLGNQIHATKLLAKLTTYHIENSALLEEPQDQEKHQIAVSKEQEQEFEFFSSYGFSSPPVTFVSSI